MTVKKIILKSRVSKKIFALSQIFYYIYFFLIRNIFLLIRIFATEKKFIIFVTLYSLQLINEFN